MLSMRFFSPGKIAGTAILLALAWTIPVHADVGGSPEETGCCHVLESGSSGRYVTATFGECQKLNATYLSVLGDNFIANQVAKPGGYLGCEEKVQTQTPRVIQPLGLKLQVSIPGFEKFSEVLCNKPEVPCAIPWLAEYIQALYRYSLLIVSFLAVIVMMIGGVIWLLAGGNRSQIEQAQSWIKGGILGIIIAFSSYAILFILNPELTILRPLNIIYIEKKDVEWDGIDLSKTSAELNIPDSELSSLRGANPYQEGCGNMERCRQYGDTKPSGLVKVNAEHGNVYVKAEIYEAFKKALACVNKDKVMFTITDGWRSANGQIDVKQRKGKLAARPCCSNHGSGSAMDLAKAGGGQMSWEYNDSSGLTKCMNQNGLYARLTSSPNEPWHWSPSGR